MQLGYVGNNGFRNILEELLKRKLFNLGKEALCVEGVGAVGNLSVQVQRDAGHGDLEVLEGYCFFPSAAQTDVTTDIHREVLGK